MTDAAEPSPAVTPPTPEPPRKWTADERKAALDRAIAYAASQGWRLETRSDFQATVVKGHRTNHILHLILTVITLGIWLIVWILVALLGGEKREFIAVNEIGQVSVSKV